MKEKNKYIMILGYAVFMGILLIIGFKVQERPPFENYSVLCLIFILLAFFIGFILIGILFLQILKINHEGFKRLGIVSTIFGALLFLFLYADSLEIFRNHFYSHGDFFDMIFLFNLGLLTMLIIINALKWLAEGFYNNKNK